MNPIEFARNLFLLRREHRMTIEDLAAAMEVTPEVVCEWECAKTSPSLEQMNRLAKVYGIPLADVIRNPKPINTAPTPEPIPEPKMEEPAPQPEPETPEPEPTPQPKKKKPTWWEILVILLLILIIAAAVVFLIKPEWFPFRELLGMWHLYNPIK